MITNPEILEHDEGILVVVKPSGWSTHDAGPDSKPHLTDWLKDEGLQQYAAVHRLDKDTSGIIIMAASSPRRAELSHAFAEGLVHKEYLALVHGKMRKKGVIRRPLQDGRRGKPLPAVTRYKLIELLGRFSLIQITIETGRKHQIRRHLQGIGHPVVGDRRYRARGKQIPEPPMMLHAFTLVLPDGKMWQADIPEPFQQRLMELKST